jgi:hypothetical protein
MSHPIRFALVLHNHQPVGNFDGVIEQAYQDSYLPFLEVLEQYPNLRIGLHTSGSLAEWLAARHPEYLDRLGELAAAGRVEILGGAFYEPILPMLPRRDRIGQIMAYTQWLQERLGVAVRGMWIPERVWEQCLASDLAAAGIAYTVLDDYHFKNAGLAEEQLHGYYVTEDDGRMLAIFPGSERLRYTIPFADPQETIEYLRRVAERHPHTVVVFGDDGEKFGTWPETKKHVYQDGWLRRFFDALLANASWIQLTTLAEAFEHVAPTGKIYLPDASYREMTEWALPAEQLVLYERMRHELQHDPRWPVLAQFMRGGFWRNFKVKYPESDEMYTRMLLVSNRLAAVETSSASTAPPERAASSDHGALPDRAASLAAGEVWQRPGRGPEPTTQASVVAAIDARNGPAFSRHVGTPASTSLVHAARQELYRAQCNCAYWHGAFGGIYLPHLRHAVYSHLIAADNLLEQHVGRAGCWIEAAHGDLNLDAREEVYLANDKLAMLFSPFRGGMMYELDVRAICRNLLATLARRFEAYHVKVQQGGHESGGQVASIHDRVVFKQPNLHERLHYDPHLRKTLLDHFYEPHTGVEAVAAGLARECGDFCGMPYEARIRRNPDRIQVQFSRSGHVEGQPLKLTKAVTLEAGSSTLEITYLVEGLLPQRPLHLAVEFNFAGMPAGWDDRYYHDGQGRRLGQLGRRLDLVGCDVLGLTDEYLGLELLLRFSQPANMWAFPIETVSQSEGGFELVHQSVAVLPHWQVSGDAQGRWSVSMQLAIDTTLAESRAEREAVAAAS